MESIKSKPTRRSMLGRVAAGCLVAAGFAIAAVSPAMADGWDRGHGHYEHGGGGYYGDGYHGGGYYGGPRVVYVQPRPVIVRQAPVYYAPQPVYVAPPPPVYYQPAPVVYAPPLLNVVIPLRFH
ncbi:MAG TPA: hypothetical protein VM639_07010 [Dongiaceae bacterium]|nr:hypothetical protein [Dongiaceae bacterium]